MKVAINKCYGGFGLSEAAYEKLIEWGIPARPYIQEIQGEGGRFLPEPKNEGEIIFDRALYKDRYPGGNRYWDCWTRENREHPLVVRVIEELGDKANGDHAKLKVVVIPDGVEYEIGEYDGQEWVAEIHKTWG